MKINELDYISILGPTGSGKSELAIELARQIPIEIISVDSVSVYRGLDIGSAKPTLTDQQSVVHHLIDICDLNEVFTVGKFVEQAKVLVQEIKQRGRLPVFCGGTIMYMKALQGNYHNLPCISPATERDVSAIYEKEGVCGLYQRLKEEDPLMAEKLHFNDRQRVQRALAVKRETGQSLSEYWGQGGDHQLNGHDFLLMVTDRKQHRVKLAERVDQMLMTGFDEECKALLEKYGEGVRSHPAIRSIGYKEMTLCICESLTIKDVRELMIVSSAQFVKRQMTWLNAWPKEKSTRFLLNDDNSTLSHIASSIVETLIR